MYSIQDVTERLSLVRSKLGLMCLLKARAVLTPTVRLDHVSDTISSAFAWDYPMPLLYDHMVTRLFVFRDVGLICKYFSMRDE